MYSPVKFYIYIYIYIDKWFICVCVQTIYMSKMGGKDHENLTTN